MFFIEEGRSDGDDGFEEEGFREERQERKLELDFAWMIYVGMQVGYTERQIGQMYLGKWCRICEQYKKSWNMRIKKLGFAEKEEVKSVFDL